jgi:large subunit ribosomal protein L9
MKVLLVKDVYKLGRAGDIKKVADGYGRNFLLPQRLAVLATEGALKQVQKIKAQAEISRNAQNNELAGVADQIKAVTLTFPAKAGDTGKLYGSITTQDIASALSEQIKFEIKRQQVGIQPIRSLGEVTGNVRLTMDLVPEFKIIVHREGESADSVTAVAPVEEEKVEKKKGGKSKEAPATEETVAEEAPAAE